MAFFKFRSSFLHDLGAQIFGLWNFFIVVVAAYTTIIIPLVFAVSEPQESFVRRETFLTIVYSLDTLISLIRIAKKISFMHIEYNASRAFYQRWFVADIVAALPWTTMLGFPLLEFLRLVKIAKVVYLVQIFRRLKAHFSNPLLIVQILYWAAVATHWLCCGWLKLRGLDYDLDLFTNYVDALYWTTSTLTTVGYGDITPVTTFERLYASATMIFGYTFFGYLIGNFAGILVKKDPIRDRYNQNLEKLTNAARYANLPLDLQRRIYEYFRYQMARRVGYDEESFINELPNNMRGEVSLYFRKEVIESLTFFDDASEEFILDVAQQLHSHIIAPDEYVFRAGDHGQQMFLIAHGTLNVLTEDEKHTLSTLSAGDFFGEIALFQEVPRTATVKAETYCDIYSLNKQTFDNIIKNYPHIAEKLREKAEERTANRG